MHIEIFGNCLALYFVNFHSFFADPAGVPGRRLDTPALFGRGDRSVSEVVYRWSHALATPPGMFFPDK